MKDSILNGTGNSRFLKSAIPDGTSWAAALAMLRGGSFPIDLNGINSAGFQQMGTPLNKVNLLRDITAQTLGLTGDAVPDDLFDILAHAGDLHVWKKAITSSGKTTISYPVSTDPNAYQEGNNAKPAGYKLGDVVSKYLISTADARDGIKVDSVSVSVSDAGALSTTTLDSLQIQSVSSAYVSQIQAFVRGKNIMIHDYGVIYGNASYLAGVFYIPEDAVITYITNGISKGYPHNNCYVVSKAQKITGYAAIPANTTIEYRGCLGDRPRMQMVSYVGTGTYGADNPCSLTFDFAPKFIFMLARYRPDIASDGLVYFPFDIGTSGGCLILPEFLTQSDYTQYFGFWYGDYSRVSYAKLDGEKTILWYNTRAAATQANVSGYTYYAIAFA